MMFTKFLTAGAGLAALAAAAPSSAQYQYGYQPYGNPYGYGYNYNQMAVAQCQAAVQARLNNRSNNGLAGILGTVLGANTHTTARIVQVTQINPNRNRIRVRGLASSGRMAYNPYGYGYYGAVGGQYAAPADLAFKCDVDYRGRVRDVDLNRR